MIPVMCESLIVIRWIEIEPPLFQRKVRSLQVDIKHTGPVGGTCHATVAIGIERKSRSPDGRIGSPVELLNGVLIDVIQSHTTHIKIGVT